jgi:pSer/pThr/pTyr-binding forkhead associated (FHA) protein
VSLEFIPVNLQTVIISALVGVVTSAITAYFTTRLRIKEEKEKWRREFAVKYAEVQATDNSLAQKMATQFAIGVLIKNPKSDDRERIFIPPHCRLVAGRSQDNPISIDPSTSRQHCAFDANDTDVYAEELGSPNGSFINGEQFSGRRKLETGDIIAMGQTTFRFHKLDGRN